MHAHLLAALSSMMSTHRGRGLLDYLEDVEFTVHKLWNSGSVEVWSA
jgi:hypothetical protein